MAHSINGVGTTFYGKRDFRADGSYVTTEWVVLLWLPLIPLRSFRVSYQGSGPTTGLGTNAEYRVFARTLPNWKQVISVYALILLSIAWLWFLFRIARHLRSVGVLAGDDQANALAIGILIMAPARFNSTIYFAASRSQEGRRGVSLNLSLMGYCAHLQSEKEERRGYWRKPAEG